jgi:putative acetyltransferase
MPVSKESPDQPQVIALIADPDAYQDTLYPPEARYALDLASPQKSNGIFMVARDGEGSAVGCGAVVINDCVGELKRMYVRPQNRGQGVARSVLVGLEAASLGQGARSCCWKPGRTGLKRWLSTASKGRQGAGRLGRIQTIH